MVGVDNSAHPQRRDTALAMRCAEMRAEVSIAGRQGTDSAAEQEVDRICKFGQ